MRLALRATFASKATWPILKALAKSLKGAAVVASGNRFGRVGLVAVGAVAVFGGQGAGIAALGGAIGLPLWIVVGSGYAFAETLQAALLAAARGED